MLNHGFRAFSLALLFILAAGCAGQAVSTPLTTAFPTLPIETQASATPDRLGTSSAAYDLTATQRALTPSLTPTATVFRTPRPTPTQTLIPSITPTYDYSPFETRTPAPAARCPVFPQLIASTPSFETTDQLTVTAEEVLDYLNNYGPDALILFYQHLYGKNFRWRIKGYADYTGDGVRELAFGWGFLYIFGCRDGRFTLLYQIDPDENSHTPDIIKVFDANRNSIPEISLQTRIYPGGVRTYAVIEWDGSRFAMLLDEVWAYASGNFNVEDIDQDGYFEYLLNVGIPVMGTYPDGIPWREEKDYFRWNGQEYIFSKPVFSPPEYRFQAIQDGERALVIGESERALEFYRQAIYNQQLGWWTPERRKFEFDKFKSQFTGDPIPLFPQPDQAEYDAIAAYARFKIMLIYVSRGWLADAKIIYENIQRDCPPESTTHPYAELAGAFWNAFNQNQNIAVGCQTAIDYALSNQDDILVYIGGGTYFGIFTAIQYDTRPDYICPFR